MLWNRGHQKQRPQRAAAVPTVAPCCRHTPIMRSLRREAQLAEVLRVRPRIDALPCFATYQSVVPHRRTLLDDRVECIVASKAQFNSRDRRASSDAFFAPGR
jgi:hypothetical protein